MDVLREKIELPKRNIKEGIVRVYRLEMRRVGGQRSVMLGKDIREKLGVDERDHLLVLETEEGDFYLEKEERD